MSFTIKDLFSKVSLPGDQLQQHRLIVGRSVKDSWNSRYTESAGLIEEDGVLVRQYPDHFRAIAEGIVCKYVAVHIAPKQDVTPSPKRKRIAVKAVKLFYN